QQLRRLRVARSPEGASGPVRRGFLVALGSAGKSLTRELLAFRRRESHLLTVGRRQRVGERIEVERAGEGERDHQIRAGDEGERLLAAVVAPGEVAVERADDRV